MRLPIIDLHCDLLSYLVADAAATPFDSQVHCSIPQMLEGNVRLQTLAIGFETKPDSAELGLRQAEICVRLLQEQSEHLRLFEGCEGLEELINGTKVGVIPAIENASAFCEEDELLTKGFERFEKITELVGAPLYVSLTWNFENRFGGGALTDVGLKSDGKDLLEFLNGRQVAIDLSHTSDKLAYDLLDYIAARQLDIAVMASHSNARIVASAARNLPNELLQEIFQRKGIVGLNFVKKFVGEDPSNFAKHVDAIHKLGGGDYLCFGADYFFGGNFPANSAGQVPVEWFFSEFDDSSCYPRMLAMFKDQLQLSISELEKLAYGNANDFLRRLRIGTG